MVLEKTHESPLDCKEIQPVHSKGDQPWVFFGRNDAKAETPVLWPPQAKSWLTGKDSDAGRDWGQEEKGTTEDEMAGWHHWLDGRWVWVNSRSWWWAGRPGVLRFMGSQSMGHDWVAELNWTEVYTNLFIDGLNMACHLIQPSISSYILSERYRGNRMANIRNNAWKIQSRKVKAGRYLEYSECKKKQKL